MFTLIVKIRDRRRLSQTSKFYVHTHPKNRRRRGQSRTVESRNASDSSDHAIKIVDRLGCLGWCVHTGHKNSRRRKSVPFLRFLGQVGTRLDYVFRPTAHGALYS